MNLHLKKSFYLFFLLFAMSCKAPVSNENTTISIKTTLGDIKIRLYDGTPYHRDNFIRLINSGFYDGISFHRVIKNFMIQAGDPATKSSSLKNIPDSLKTYTIPSEFNNQYFHKKGALAAARQGNDINPEMRSSGTQFYIVQGVKLSDDELNMAENQINSNIKQGRFTSLIKETTDSIRLAGKSMTDAEIQEIASLKMFQYLTSYKNYRIPEEQRNVYKTIGGTPRLDGTYTVFGEVIEGLDIIDKIAEVQTDSSDKPLSDIKIIKIKIVKN
ncbi:MAG: peptidylprolyl isomerase [Bacteroidales bacterium]|jgi:cyclophilin family peptidyl-prolyl cis-trans isomerase